MSAYATREISAYIPSKKLIRFISFIQPNNLEALRLYTLIKATRKHFHEKHKCKCETDFYTQFQSGLIDTINTNRLNDSLVIPERYYKEMMWGAS